MPIVEGAFTEASFSRTHTHEILFTDKRVKTEKKTQKGDSSDFGRMIATKHFNDTLN